MVANFAQGQPQSTQAYVLPAPVGGIRSTENFAAMDPNTAIYTYNLTPSQFGLEVRSGYREWFTNFAEDIRTIIPFDGPDEDSSKDRLFAVTIDGIFDVTSKGTSPPAAKVAFPSSNPSGGQGVFTTFTNTAGATYAFYADNIHGLYEYDSSVDTWAAVTGVTGITETDIRFVASHMNRLWFALQDDPDPYYLAIGAISGAATKFYLSHTYSVGGDLVGIYSWTIDDGSGTDDQFVAVSRAGDVVVYQGTDPASATTWGLVGTWHIGRLPAGRKVGISYAGDVFLLCSQGIISIIDLLRGVSAELQNFVGRVSAIARILREDIRGSLDVEGWHVFIDTVNAALIILTPSGVVGTKFQYVMDLVSGAWGFWRDLDMRCAAILKDTFYWGADDSTVQFMEGNLDHVAFDGTGGDSIEFSLLSAYSHMDSPGVHKIVQFIRPTYISGGPQAVSVKALYDYDLQEIMNTAVPTPLSGDLWDAGIWDTAVWGGSRDGFSSLVSPRGIGRTVAIAMKGSSNNDTTLVSWDVMWTPGGPL